MSIKRFFYKRAMLKAIDKARTDTFSGDKTTRTNGLRAIKTFERVNRERFNPFNSRHVFFVSGCGGYEGFLRWCRLNGWLARRTTSFVKF